jgi:hypothetical protein
MTKKMSYADFQKKRVLAMEHCADNREWGGNRIGNLSREEVVNLFGEGVIAELDKIPFEVNCPLSSNESYTDPDARNERNSDVEYYATIVYKDNRGCKLGSLIHVSDGIRHHYLLDGIEKLTRDQKIRKALEQFQTNNSFIQRSTRENEQILKQLKKLFLKD